MYDKYINELFDYCVEVLIIGAKMLGMTYNEINIWIFCIIEPIVFIIMFLIIINQYLKIKHLRNEKIKK